MMGEQDRRAGGDRRLIVIVVISVVSTVGLLGAGLLLVAHLVLGYFESPDEHHNQSFRYGEKLMEDYGAFNYAPAGASTEEACRAAVRLAADPPAKLDQDEAVRGCLYTEFYLDN